MLINKNGKKLVLRLGFGCFSPFFVITWGLFAFQTPGITGTSLNPGLKNQTQQSIPHRSNSGVLKNDILVISDLAADHPSITNLGVLYPGRIMLTKGNRRM